MLLLVTAPRALSQQRGAGGLPPLPEVQGAQGGTSLNSLLSLRGGLVGLQAGPLALVLQQMVGGEGGGSLVVAAGLSGSRLFLLVAGEVRRF